MASIQNMSTMSVQEFAIRVPKNLRKKHHVMRFNGNLNVDFTQWRNVKMERENNLKEFKGIDENIPKFGAGSEYNRDLKEEVRRKKYGIIAKRYKPEAQPWILKVGGKSGKKFRGIREGGVSDNASFYVFTHAPDGAIEAYPLNEWYNFQPIQRYKTLTAEEAEHELSNRKKTLNLFALMFRKRMKGDEEEDPEIEGDKKKVSKKDFKISELDEWMESDDEDETEGEDKKSNSGDDRKKKKPVAPQKKKKRDLEDEAFEESDDGDEEGRELDYISESTENDSDLEVKSKELKSVAEEDGLRGLLTSEEDEEEEEENKSKGESDVSNAEKVAKEAGKDEKEAKEKKKKKRQKKRNTADSSSDLTSHSSDSSNEVDKLIQKKKVKEKSLKITNVSRSASPSILQDGGKRKSNNSQAEPMYKEHSDCPVSTPGKRVKLEIPIHSFASGVINTNNKDDYGITEEAVRRYLMRKPMTTIELLTKFKNKKTGVSSDKLVETMTQILKRINPVKQTIQGKMYLSIKAAK